LRADALDMPFDNNTLDAVFSFDVLHVLEKPEKLIQETVRILKTGGQFYLSALCSDRKISKIVCQ
jgi:ubiquinone/menaquinone biosynthesis C-methylase UbiE